MIATLASPTRLLVLVCQRMRWHTRCVPRRCADVIPGDASAPPGDERGRRLPLSLSCLLRLAIACCRWRRYRLDHVSRSTLAPTPIAAAQPCAQPDGRARVFNLANICAARRLARTLIWFPVSTEANEVLLFQHRGNATVSAIGDAAGSSMTTVDQADMRALVSTRLFCVMELPRSRLWGVGVDPIQ